MFSNSFDIEQQMAYVKCLVMKYLKYLLFFFFFNFACAKKDMENNPSLTVAVPEDRSPRVSISSLTLWEMWLLPGSKSRATETGGCKNIFFGVFCLLFF